MIYAIALLWLTCGIATVGYLFAYFQRRYPELRKSKFRADAVFALAGGLFGPFGLVVSWGYRDYGWLWPFCIEAREEAGL